MVLPTHCQTKNDINKYYYNESLLKFLFKKIKALTFLGFKALRSLVTVKPTAEKTLSEEVVVAGIQSSRLATYDTNLKRLAFNFHHTRELSHLGVV